MKDKLISHEKIWIIYTCNFSTYQIIYVET